MLVYAWGGTTNLYRRYEWQSPASKVLRLGTLLVVLILVATYTANMAAFFTVPACVMLSLAQLRGFLLEWRLKCCIGR
jgi:hypothetical protein